MTTSSLPVPMPQSLSMPSTPKQSSSRRNEQSRIRRRPVSFGNPALGTYEGVVFTWEDVSNESFDDKALPITLTPTSLSLDCVAAMINVPPEQVPEGVLHLARSHQRQIKHARILISSHRQIHDDLGRVSVSPTETLIPQTRTSPGAASRPRSKSEFFDRQQSPSSTTNQRSSSDDIVLPSPSASAVQSAAAIFAADPSPHLKSPERQSSRDLDACVNDFSRKQKVQHRTYLVLFVLSSSRAARQFVEHLNNKPYTTLDETQVAHVHHVVGLEGGGTELQTIRNNTSLLKSSPISTSSSPRGSISEGAFSNQYTAQQEEHNETHEVHNCAVCLDPLDDDSDEPPVIITTVCNHSFHWACLWRCKDSPCPVCRYDHADLNEALSQCHICGTTEQTYVCLICGIISCASANTTTTSISDMGGSAAVSTSLGHAQKHYDDTLHAYALDTETQHVWDFCGQGYVHRLLQNTSDGKIVEVSQQDFNQRLPEAGRLSDAQEDEVVHRKLEGFAQQYYALLKSQLEEQRAYYDGRVDELLRGIKESQIRTNKSKNSSSEALMAALKHERRQVHHRLVTLKDRYQKLADEVSFLKNLNESLETNKEQMRRQVLEGQRQRSEARRMIEQALPPLERKVHSLMLQLEQQGGDEEADSKMAAR